MISMIQQYITPPKKKTLSLQRPPSFSAMRKIWGGTFHTKSSSSENLSKNQNLLGSKSLLQKGLMCVRVRSLPRKVSGFGREAPKFEGFGGVPPRKCLEVRGWKSSRNFRRSGAKPPRKFWGCTFLNLRSWRPGGYNGC